MAWGDPDHLRDPNAPFDPLRLWSTGHKHDGRKVVLAVLCIALLAWAIWL